MSDALDPVDPLMESLQRSDADKVPHRMLPFRSLWNIGPIGEDYFFINGRAVLVTDIQTETADNSMLRERIFKLGVRSPFVYAPALANKESLDLLVHDCKRYGINVTVVNSYHELATAAMVPPKERPFLERLITRIVQNFYQALGLAQPTPHRESTMQAYANKVIVSGIVVGCTRSTIDVDRGPDVNHLLRFACVNVPALKPPMPPDMVPSLLTLHIDVNGSDQWSIGSPDVPDDPKRLSGRITGTENGRLRIDRGRHVQRDLRHQTIALSELKPPMSPELAEMLRGTSVQVDGHAWRAGSIRFEQKKLASMDEQPGARRARHH